MWGRIISIVRYDLKKIILYILLSNIIYISLWYGFCPLTEYYVDAHHVTDAKQHGQEVLGYGQYAFSG
jgi:hypothetical protein